MVLKVMYVIELLDADDGGIELVDPAWTGEKGSETVTGTDFDVNISDVHSEFSEYSTISRKSTSAIGPEEGPPRKKIKSPPAISPTGSSTSLYSGGSSIDWTTTGTTLDMQGTRVTRTQYGFRTLQESSAKMCLKVTGYPLPEITWYKDDVLLKEDERRTFYADDDGFFAMTIDPVQATDTGRYTCVATNEYGQASTSAFFKVLKVEKEAAPPAFANSLRDQECKEGDVVNFECEVEGWPEPELVWLVDEQPLRPSHDFRLQYDGQKASLEIRDAQPDDTGIYAVRITNEFGTKETNAKLVVQPDPDKNHVAPEFQAVTEDVECDEGDTVKFKAVITGDPEPEIAWYVNGHPLTASEKIKFISEDGICIVTIKDVSRHFDGTVTCEGKNRLGTTTCDARLKVRVPPLPPQFDRPLEDRIVTEKSAVMFEVDVSGYPDPKVEFFLKGKKLEDGVNGVAIVQRDNYYKVTIQNCSLTEHDGEVLARAINEHGQAESRARLVVEPEEEDSRSAPTFLKDIEDQTVKMGEKATFTTCVKGSPNPTVSWFINGEKLEANNEHVKIDVNGSDHKLVVDSSKYAGTVLCRAENPIGRFETKARLIVLPLEKKKKAPEFVQPLTDVTELQGNTAVFEVTVDAEPKATLTWKVNGVTVTENEKFKFREFNGSSKLEIHNIDLNDVGTVTCTATNSEGEATCQAKLNMNRKEQKPILKKKPQNQTVPIGQRVTFEAQADAVPAAEFTWYIDGKKVWNSTQGTTIETDSQSGSTKLHIDTNVLPNPATIVIVAENKLGTDEGMAQLFTTQATDDSSKFEHEKLRESAQFNVSSDSGEPTTTISHEKLQEGGRNVISFEAEEEPYRRESIERFEEHAHSNVQHGTGFDQLQQAQQQLVMQKELFNQRVQRGHQAQFQTNVQNADNVRWFMGDQLLAQGTPGIRFPQGAPNEHILIIESAQSSTTIKFEAGSGDNQIQSLARLDVADRPTFSHGGLNPVVKVEEGQPVVLNVKFTEEAKINWSYNDKPIIEAVPGAQVTTEHGESILRIPEAKPDMNNAVLGVTAENEFGKASEETKLVVDKKGEPPKITKGPPNKSVHEHEVVLFSAEVSQVQPTPQVEWRVNGELVTPQNPTFALSQVGNQYMLRVNDASMNHTGNVTVTAKNSAGEDSAQSTFEVKKKQKPLPSFKQDLPGDLNAKEGEPLKVTVNAPNADQINWSLNGQPLKDGQNGVQITQNGPESILNIPSVSKDHAGKLGVEAVNETGKQNSDSNLNVTPKGSPPKVTEWPKGAQVTEKETVQFSAVITGEPKPEVQWVVNNKVVPASADNFVLSDDGNRYTLTVKDTKLENGGEVRVEAKNIHGSDKAAAYLEIKPAPKPPIFKQKLNDANVDEGKPATFTVTLENPTPDTKVTWSLNGKPLENGPNAQITDNGNGTYTLTIPNATPDIAGKVAVKAENPIGANESDANLNVKPALKPPIFKQGLGDQNVNEGKPGQFTAVLENPTPDTRITWLLNGTPIQNGPNAQISDNGNGTYTLNIPSATPDQTGKISIKAENPAGSNDSNANLNVKPALKPPIFKQGLTDANVDEGKPATFTVTLENPTPDTKLTWFLNGNPVQAGPNAQISDNGNGTYTLTIPNATPDQSGKVSVKAENPAGANESNANLNVKPALKAPIFKANLTDKTVNEGQPIRYDVALENPTPDTKLTWLLNGKPLENGDQCQIADHGDGTYHLTLSHATPDMNGQLTVKAENPAGTTDSSAKIEVKVAGDKPKFSKVPQDAETEEDASVKFSAYVSGKPSPKVTWYLNGEEVKDSDVIRVKHDAESGKTSIRIYKPTIPQSGTVKVVAENEHGRIEAQANLTISKKRDIPEFMTDMSDRQINEGESAKFVTRIVGYPEPEVTWTIDDKPISANNIKVSASGDTHTLEITDAKIEQTGEVSCAATNSKGTKKQNAQLIVKEVGRAPLFIRNLEDKLVDERETVVMLAELDPKVKPKPTASWFKDGQPLVSDDHIKVEISENGQCKLMILQAQLTDKCRISIKAENQYGTAETAASIAVQRKQMQSKPQFLSELQPLVIQEGDSLQTSILISGNPVPNAKWYINDQLVCQTEDTEIKNENGVYSLVIHGCTTDMTGKIKVTAVNRMGEVSTEGKLTVIAPIPVEFETSLCDATCREGDTLKLKAVLVGEPMPDVTWYVNGKKLVESQKIKIHAEKGTYTVTIKDITMDYSGKVLCEAVNEFGKASSEAMLKVLPRGEPPDFLEWLSNVRARAGSKVEHKVVFTGDPKPVLYWYINNKEVKDGVDGITIKTTDNTSILTINSFNPEAHVGEIICKAENDAGEVSCTANMILYTSDMVSESESDAFAEDRLEDFKEDTREELTRTPTPVMAPSFITKIKDTTAKKGHQAIFECVVPDTKGVCCKWLKDGKEIELIARIRVQQRTIDGHIANELIIDDVLPEDAGKYTVVVENTAGKDQCEATLTVIDALEKKAPENKAPEFTVKLQDKSTPLKEKVVLECKVTGVPEPAIAWFKDNKPVAETGEPIKVESKPDGTQVLIIESAQVSSQGEYKCVAKNDAGEAKTEAKVTVEAQPPLFTKPLSDKEIKVGETIILECSVTGTPQPNVEFYSVVDNVRLQSGTRVAVQHDASNTHWRLVIKDTKENDLREYKAVAKNAAGEVTCQCVVRASGPKMEKPKITDGLKQTKVKEGETTEMGVKVAVNPEVQPEVEWFKDGKKIEPEADHVKILSDHATGSYVLKVLNARASDEGEYTVKVTNKAGSDQSEAKMAVEKEEFVAPEFVQPLEGLEVAEHDTAELKVQVTGKPQPEVTWLKDNTPINIDNSHVIRKDGAQGEHSLTIKDVQLADAGKYSCQAVNKAGQAETKANFGVQEEAEAPKFIEGLKPVEIKEAETAKFDVVVAGKPEPEVQWFKDGRPVQLDGEHVIASKSADGKHSLTIKDARNVDAGTYSAKAVNKAGSDESKANLGVIEDVEAPEFIKPLEDLEVSPADSVKLEVKVVGKPEPEVAWTKNGEPVHIDNQHIVSKKEQDGTHSLTINDATTADAGTYSCQATNKAGRKESIGQLKFGQEGQEQQGEDVAPMFIEPLKQLNIEEGKPTELICKVNPESKPEIKWFKDGHEVKPTQNLVLEQSEDGTIKLKILKATSEDVGEYRCEAVNKAGADKTIGALKYAQISTIEGQEEEAGFIGFEKELQDQTVQKAKETLFECKLDEATAKNPDVQVEWSKDGTPLSKGSPKKNADGTLTLKLEDTQIEDSGKYQCTVKAKDSEAFTAASLTVTDSGAGEGQGKGVPEFVELLKSCTVPEEQKAVLSCEVKGAPRPTIKWYKNGAEIKDSDEVKLEYAEDGRCTLTINKAKMDDSAEYRCLAENDHGTAWTEGPIVVTSKDAPKIDGEAPDFVQPVKPVIVEASKDAVFVGKVTGAPFPTIKWYRGKEEISPADAKFKIESEADGIQRLIVKDCKLEDAGDFRCSASNEHGDVWSDTILTVTTPKVKAPEFEKELEAVDAKQGEDAIFECKLADDDNSKVDWYKGNEKLVPSDNVIIEALPNGVHRLILKNVSQGDQGNYRVEATNPSGSASSKAPLNVQPASEFKLKKGLQDQSLHRGQKLHLSVEVEGKPSTVKWYKDEQEVVGSSKVVIQKVTDEVYSLTVENSELSDTGSYKVFLSNGIQSIESSCKVTVTEGVQAPSFRKPLNDATVPKGAPIRLEVEVDGNPTSVKWFKDGEPLPDNIAQDLGNGKYALNIPEAKAEDFGRYSVQVANEAGQASSAANVNEDKSGLDEGKGKEGEGEGKEAGEKPKIVEGLVPQTVQVGEPARFQIKVAGPVKQVKWYKNGKELGPEQAKEVAPGVYALEIPEAEKSDSGDFKVVVSNDHGEADSSAALTVKLPPIKIVKGLEDTEVPKGAEAILYLETDRPPKAIKWYKNGKELGPSEKPKASEVKPNSFQLVIPEADDDDAGTFKAIVFNDDDEPTETFCALTVKLPPKVNEKPKILDGLVDKFVPVGKELEAAIKTSGNPTEVKWYKNGAELTPSATLLIQKVDDNTFTIRIPKSTLDDTGNYEVVVSNSLGSDESKGVITVEEAISFLKPLKDQEVIEGERVEFTVETNTKPHTIKWYRNGQEIAPDNRIELTQDGNVISCVLKWAQSTDQGQFKVVLTNSHGPAESQAKLTVNKKLTPAPKIVKGLEDAIVAKGDAIIFEVVVDGEVTDVKWLKDGKNVTNEPSFNVEKVDDKTFKLTIPASELDHAGDYEVQLSNDGGKATSSAVAEVDELPKIVKGLIPGDVDEGDEHLFRVEVSAPVRQVKWYKNGQELAESPQVQMKKVSPKKYELLLPKSLAEDAGDYKVVLSNKAGSCDSEAPLTVKKLQTVKIVKPLQDVTLDEGQELVLSCQVEGVPKGVKWYRNGQEVTPSDRVILSANDNGEYTLKVPSSQPGDGAAYRIVFETDKGDVQSGCVAHVRPKKVEEEKTTPTFVSPLQDTTIPEGEILTLKCQVHGKPAPTVKWYRNGQELVPSDRIVQRLALDGTATLRIMDAKKEDAGDFKVVATNDSGSAESACVVKVLSGDELPSAPKFVIPLKDTKTPLDGTAIFNVKVKGTPKPEVVFTLNGRTIAADGQRIIVEDLADGNFCLTIKNVTDADFGTLKCTATNENGKAECSANFGEDDSQKGAKEEEGYPPKFNVPLWDRRVIDRQPTSIECHVDAKPRADITWFKDGKELTSQPGIEIDNSFDGACRVRFTEFSQEHCGQYKCVAKNEYGVADTISHLSIETEGGEEAAEEKESAPKFNPGLTDAKINEGENLELSCKVEGTPKPSIVWYKDGIPLTASDIISIDQEDDGTCRLRINGATAQHQGAYRCVASNKNGTTNTACLVTVHAEKEEKKKEGAEPFFTKGLVDQWLDRGETLTLHCEVEGDPKPEIKWYRNGMLLKPNDKITIENTPDGKCTCIIKDCNMTDEGVYRCEAENAHGKAKTQCNAHVDMELSKAEPLKVEEGQAPRFIIPLEDVTTVKGSNVALECKVTGTPMPSCKWTKDGVPLFDDSRYEWDNNPAAGTYRLLIKDFTQHYEGTYRCVATNEAGSATTKAFVKLDDSVSDRKDVRPPNISAKLSDVRVNEGQPLKLECRIDSDVTPEVVWYKDGAKVSPSDRIQLELTPDGYARLIIPSATLDDDGMYRIVASNEAGSAHDKCTATVKKSARPAEDLSGLGDGYEAGKAPKVVIPLETIRVNEKNGFTLRCKFSGAPKLAIKWFKDGERLYSYSHAQITENEDGSTELVVTESAKSDAGTYRCVAENDFGSARTTGQVTVTAKSRQPRNINEQLNKGKAPGFTIPLTIKKAKLGETVTFECLPYGEPFPTIKWMKDGMELLPKDGITIEAAEDGTQRLIVANVDQLSEGYYRCVATNEHGTASTKAELVLIGDKRPKPAEEAPAEPEEGKPRIRPGLHNQSIHQGNTIEMQICALGLPTPTVKWYKDGEEIHSDGAEGKRTIWTDERGFHHCVIINAAPEDEGEYSVVATNPHGEARSVGNVSVILPRAAADEDGHHGIPFPPGFIRQLKNKHVFTKLPTIFDCLVVGYPPPEVEWFHNGKRITPGGRIKIQSCGGGSHALLITDTTPEDAGEYVAIAKNSHGTASSSAILDVTVPHLDEIKFDGTIDITPYLTEEYGFKKINYKCLPTPPDYGPFIKEVTGHYLTLSWIPTKRSPPRYPQVTYVVEIRELPYRDWTLLDYNIPEPVCKVRNLELGKSYQFRVRAENIYGISDPSPASPPSRLMAPPQPVMDRNKRIIPLLDPYAERALDLAYAEQYACAPWFAPGAVDKRYCAENDTLIVNIKYSGYPDPKIVWKFRGWDVDSASPTSNLKVTTYGGSDTTLTISSFSRENVGQYQVIATNQYGEAQQNVYIDLATRPTFLQPLNNRTFQTGAPVKLDVRIEGSPFPEVKWMKEWHPVVESSRIKIVREGPYLCSLIINDPMWRDSGIYSCVAYNDAGQASTSCSIDVDEVIDYSTPRPKRKVDLEQKNVREIYEIAEEDEPSIAE